MKVSKVKQGYQLQEWSGMIQQWQESGLSVRQWCQEQGIKADAYYYRLMSGHAVEPSIRKVKPKKLM